MKNDTIGLIVLIVIIAWIAYDVWRDIKGPHRLKKKKVDIPTLDWPTIAELDIPKEFSSPGHKHQEPTPEMSVDAELIKNIQEDIKPKAYRLNPGRQDILIELLNIPEVSAALNITTDALEHLSAFLMGQRISSDIDFDLWVEDINNRLKSGNLTIHHTLYLNNKARLDALATPPDWVRCNTEYSMDAPRWTYSPYPGLAYSGRYRYASQFEFIPAVLNIHTQAHLEAYMDFEEAVDAAWNRISTLATSSVVYAPNTQLIDISNVHWEHLRLLDPEYSVTALSLYVEEVFVLRMLSASEFLHYMQPEVWNYPMDMYVQKINNQTKVTSSVNYMRSTEWRDIIANLINLKNKLDSIIQE